MPSGRVSPPPPHTPCPAESNPLQQLDVVGNYVSDLGAIIRQFKIDAAKKQAKEAGRR